MEDIEIFEDNDNDSYASSPMQWQYEKPVWAWNIIGVVPGLVLETADVSIWKRFWTKVFFGSTWKRL
jgi:hypothetical protein